MRPQLSVLSDELIAKILNEAKRIMSETGMEIRGETMRQRLLDSGLKLDKTGKRILFTPDVVDAAVASAPKLFTLFNRDGDPYTDIGGNNVHFVPGSSGLKILDHRTGETRLADSTDFIEYARLCDGLENIAYLATAFSTNKDIESQVSDAWRLYMTLTTSKKPHLLQQVPHCRKTVARKTEWPPAARSRQQASPAQSPRATTQTTWSVQ